MKKFARGRIGRVLSMMLMALMMLPSLLGPAATAAQAAVGGRQDIVLLPLQTTAEGAPSNLDGRILRELQIALARQVGVQVTELSATSAMLDRAKRQLDDVSSELLMKSYATACDRTASKDERVKAAATLVKFLSVDAVIFGAIDNYEFTGDPDPHQSMIHLLATSVSVDKSANATAEPAPVAMPVEVIGRSRILPDGKGTQADHDADAIANTAQKLANQLAGKASPDTLDDGRTLPAATQVSANGQKPKRSWMWLLLGAAVIAAAASGGGGGGSGQPSTQALVGEALPLADGVQLSFATQTKQVSTYTVYRKEGAQEVNFKLTPTVTGGKTFLKDDRFSPNPPTKGHAYVYRAVLGFSDGTTQEVVFMNMAAPATPRDLPVGPAMAPAVSSAWVVDSESTGRSVKIGWQIVGTDPNALVKSFRIERQRTVDGVDEGWTTLGSAAAADRTYTDIVPGRGAYQYRVTSVGDPAAALVQAAEAITQPPYVVGVTEPLLPTNLQAEQMDFRTVQRTQVRLTWTNSGDPLISKYYIYRAESRGGFKGINEVTSPLNKGLVRTAPGTARNRSGRGMVLRGSRAVGTPAPSDLLTPNGLAPTATEYIDTTVQDGASYVYYIQVQCDTIEGTFWAGPSNTRTVDVPPGNAVVETAKTEVTDGAVKVYWTPPTTNADGSPISGMVNGGFFVYRMSAAPASDTGYSEAEINGTGATQVGQMIAWNASLTEYSVTDTAAVNRQANYYAVVTVDGYTVGQRSLSPYPYTSGTPMPDPKSVRIDTVTTGLTSLKANDAPAQMTVTVTDVAAGTGLGVKGVAVDVSVPSGDGLLKVGSTGTAQSTISLTTGDDGKASFFFVPPPAVPADSQATITATIADTTLTATKSLVIKAPVAEMIKLESAKDQLVAVRAADMQTPLESNLTVLTATVYDAGGRGPLCPNPIPVAGVPVSISSDSADAAYLATDGTYKQFGETGAMQVVTGNDGKVSITIRSGQRAGMPAFYARYGGTLSPGQTVSEGQVRVEVVSRPAASISVMVYGEVAGDTVRTISPASGMVTVLDDNGNPVKGEPVRISTTSAGWTVNPSATTTDDDGTATFSVLSTTLTTGEITVSFGDGSAGKYAKQKIEFIPFLNPELIYPTSVDVPMGRYTYDSYLDQTWRLKDANGLPYRNTQVRIEVSNGNLSSTSYWYYDFGQSINMSTNTSGDVTFRYYAPNTPGDVTLTFYDMQGKQIGEAKTIHVTLIPPYSLYASTLSASSIQVSWYDYGNVGVAGYEISRSAGTDTNWETPVSVPSGVSSFTDTKLQPGTTYYYRVRVKALNPVNNSPWSEVVFATTAPGAPANLQAAANSSTSVTLTWTDGNGETGYQVDRSADGMAWTPLATLAQDIDTYTDTNLQPNTLYWYRVTALSTFYVTASSTISVVTGAGAPKNLRMVTATENSIDMAWDPAPGAEGYIIQRRGEASVAWETVQEVPAGVVICHDDMNLQPGSVYYYRVRTTNMQTVEEWSPEARAMTAPASLPNLTATALSGSQTIRLAWMRPMSGVNGYRIERKTESTNWVVLAANTGTPDITTYDDAALQPSTLYTYRVAVVFGTQTSAWSNEASAISAPATPANLTATPSSATVIDLGWDNNAANGSTGYIIRRRPSVSSTWQTVADLTSPYITALKDANGIQPSSSYWYQICAVRRAADGTQVMSAWSPEVLAVTGATQAQVLGVTVVSSTEIDLAWVSVSDAMGYHILANTDGTTWNAATTIGDVAADVTTFQCKGLQPGTLYYFRVDAWNAGNSTPSTIVSATTLPAVPANVQAAATGIDITLTWADVNGETRYEVERSLDGVSWDASLIATPDANITSYVDTGLAGGTTYYYRLRAVNLFGASDWSPVVNATTVPSTPANVLATAVSGSRIDLTWDDVNGETGYEVRRSTDMVTWTQLPLVIAANAIAASDTTCQAGTTYYYQMRAVNAAGASDWSTIVSAATTVNMSISTYTLTPEYKNPRIYFSTDPDDSLYDASRTFVALTVTGKTAGGGPASRANVKITTDLGTFKAQPGQALSADRKSITGVMDAAGTMRVIYCGRADDGIASGRLTLPAISELGQPKFTAENEGITTALTAGDNGLPMLIGPPSSMDIRVTGTQPGGAGEPPVAFQNTTVTVTATARDLAGQPVLEGMPIWFTQGWTAFNASASPYDYSGVVGPANIRTPFTATDANGQATLGFTSNHSGVYDVHTFALKRNFDETKLGQVTNINDGTQRSLYTPYVLASDATGSAVTNDTRMLYKTVAAYGPSHWTVTDISHSRINLNGAMTSKVTFVATDEDGKKVLPGVPYHVWGIPYVLALNSWYMPIWSGDSMLELLKDDAMTPVTAATEMTFNQVSEGCVLVKGKGAIGRVHLFVSNTLANNDRYETPIDVTLYGEQLPDSSEYAWGFPGDQNNVPVIAGWDQDNIIPQHKSLSFKLSLMDEYDNPMPDGYVVTMLDGASEVGPGTGLTGIVKDGSVDVVYHHALNSNAGEYVSDLKARVYGEDINGPRVFTTRTVEFAPRMQYARVKVVRPVSATVTPNIASLVAPGSTVNIGAVIKDGYGDNVFDGFRIRYEVVDLPNSPGANQAITPNAVITDAQGNANTQLNVGSQASWIKVQVVYYDLVGNRYVLGETAPIHVGLAPVSTLTATTAPLTVNLAWTYPAANLPDAQAFVIDRSTDGVNFTEIARVGSTLTAYTDATGLTAATTYYYRVRAYANVGGDIFSTAKQVAATTP